MILHRVSAIFLCLALSGCGPEPAPKAAPGAVERTTEALDRDEAAERVATTKSNDREAEVRADAAARRIRASDEGRSN
jgi:hypothetical protein